MSPAEYSLSYPLRRQGVFFSFFSLFFNWYCLSLLSRIIRNWTDPMFFFFRIRLVLLLSPFARLLCSLTTANHSVAAGLRRFTSPSWTPTSTVTGCRRSSARPTRPRGAKATRTTTRSPPTTAATCSPSTATRSTFASSGPSSQGMTPRPRRPPPAAAGGSPAPGPGPVHTPGPAPIPGRTEPYPRKAPAGPPALRFITSWTGWDCGWRGWWREPCPDYGCLLGPLSPRRAELEATAGGSMVHSLCGLAFLFFSVEICTAMHRLLISSIFFARVWRHTEGLSAEHIV